MMALRAREKGKEALARQLGMRNFVCFCAFCGWKYRGVKPILQFDFDHDHDHDQDQDFKGAEGVRP